MPILSLALDFSEGEESCPGDLEVVTDLLKAGVTVDRADLKYFQSRYASDRYFHIQSKGLSIHEEIFSNFLEALGQPKAVTDERRLCCTT